MSVLSIFKCLKNDAKFIVPLLIIVGFLFKNVNSNSPVDADSDASVGKLPFCDEKLINERVVSKR